MKRIVSVVAILCSGLMAGLLFGDWLGPSFARAAMRASSFIQFQQIVHINYLRTLPALSTVAIVAPLVWLITLRARRNSAEFKVLLGATIAIAVGYTITFVFNVPLTISSRRGTLLIRPRMPEKSGVNGKKLTSCGQFSGCSDFSSKRLL